MTKPMNGTRQADHHKVARECRENPDTWVKVNTYASLYVAKTMCRVVQGVRVHSKITAYAEGPGPFDARYEMADDGWTVYAMFLGSIK